MKKWIKVFLILLTVLLVMAVLFFQIAWNGGLNFLMPEEIAVYESPDGKYTLVFEQLGDPGWPFGPADVRLTLKNSSGKTVDHVSARVYNDGTDAYPQNIRDIQWGRTEVAVTLSSGEHPDQIITLRI